ncbi:MAG: M6 family metalloprotease domain-containing protein [Breznakibacter sp.]
MVKGLLLLLLVTMAVHEAFPIGAHPDAIEVKQSDGTILKVFQHGDEWFNWTTTTDGYRIVKNPKGIFEYATLNRTGNVVASGKKAYGRSDRPVSQQSFLKSTPLHVGVNESTFVPKMGSAIATPSLLKSASVNAAFPASGNPKLLVILASFSNTAPTYTQASFDNLLNQTNYNGTGSFKDYHLENSNGLLNIQSTVTAWVTLPQTREYYAPESKWGEFAYDAIKAADAAGVDFSEFDNDGNGTVDAVAIFHVGKGQESSADLLDIWSHSYTLSDFGYTVAERTFDGKRINSYTVQPEFNNNTTNMCHIGVLCHEFGHSLGLPDYYDTDYETNGLQDGTGRWDVMAMGAYNNSNATPAHHNPFSKAELGWLGITTISLPARMTLAPVVGSQTAYRIDTQTSNEYYLLENRTQTGFDAYIPGEGMLIYHVDGNYIAAKRSINTINATSHQGLYIKKASGLLNSATSPYPGSMGNTSFTDSSTPSSLAWNGLVTNKSITGIEVDGSKNVSFDFMTLQNGMPQTFSSKTIDSQSVDLEWTASEDNYPVMIAVSMTNTFGTPVDGSNYGVGDEITGGGTVIYNGNGSAFLHAPLSPLTTYYYHIWSNKGTGYSVALNGYATTYQAPVASYPWVDDFETGLSNWHNEIINGIDEWTTRAGGYNGFPGSAYSGSKNAYFFSNVKGGKARLVSPMFVAQSQEKFRIMLQHAQVIWGADQDELRIYIKYASSENWLTLGEYTSDMKDWKHDYWEFTASESFQVALEAKGNHGYGVVLDDFRILKIDRTLPVGPSSLNLLSNAQNSIALGWTKGTGDKILVVCKEAGLVLGLPVNGTTYSASSSFGNGSLLNPQEYVVYSGTGNQVEVTNLKPNTFYYFTAFEFFEDGQIYQLNAPKARFYTVHGDVTFTLAVTDGNGMPISGAAVTCGTQTSATVSDGRASFVMPFTLHDIAYSVAVSGKKTVWGKMAGTQNRTINVQMDSDKIDAPKLLENTVFDGTVNLKWNPVIEENFTGYDPFALSIPNWTFVDMDGVRTWGLFDYRDDETGEEVVVTFPNEGYTGSFIVINPYIDEGIDLPCTPYSGNQFLGCAVAYGKTNNDWAISPEFRVTGNEWLSFMAASYTNLYGLERMRVLISENGTELSSFVEITPNPYVEVPQAWTQYKFDLSAYAGKQIRFAINCVSNDAFLFMLDDIRVMTAEPPSSPKLVPPAASSVLFAVREALPIATNTLKSSGSGSSSMTGDIVYRVFKNGELVAENEGMADNTATFDFDAAACGQSQFMVKAVRVSSGVENTSSLITLSSCANVSVVVTNGGIAVPGASVVLGTYNGLTDKDGKLAINDVPNNSYSLSVTANGYESYSATVAITETSELAVELKKLTPTMVPYVAEKGKVHPNPSKAIFRVEIDNAGSDLSYVVYNMVGRKLLENGHSPGVFNVDLGNFPNGIYLLEVSNHGKKYAFKLVKK